MTNNGKKDGQKDDQNGDQNDEKSATDSPLQRYLARQKELEVPANLKKKELPPPSVAKPPPSAETPSPAPNSRVADRFAAAAPDLRPLETLPAGFWARAFAYLIDAILLQSILWIIGLAFFALSFLAPISFLPEPSLSRYGVLSLVLMFFYYGWFYSSFGASPGKLLMQLEIVETGTGRRLGYWRSFFRETIGKFISSLLLGIGFFIAAFRNDHRALHDMIFDTRVRVAAKRRLVSGPPP